MGTFQHSEKSLISAKHRSLRLSIRAWAMIPQPHHLHLTARERDRERDRERERERERNHWLSCDHVTFGVTYISQCKTSLVYQVKIY